MIPLQARIGKTTWTTSLFSKDDRYIVPIKGCVRQAENLDKGHTVTIHLHIR